MEQPLLLLLPLVLLSFCSGQDWTPPDFCHQKKCPQYTLIEQHQDFEERHYVASDWITTKIESTTSSSLMSARSRLKEYCERQRDAGHEISDDTWPVLITNRGDQHLSLSWFVPPGTTKPENTDEVTLTSKPEGTVYVKVFDGIPSIESGQENMEKLWIALGKDCTDPPTYSAVYYDTYFSLYHHNEIWIYADDKSKCN
ncbi:heme-binding protein soul2 [Pempheris klunzingeri]|uniref:heme-binding protein soul2 n=1 Tax=Pempheris klunzingeri TaxID=3127111 RepID=UPI00397F69EA